MGEIGAQVMDIVRTEGELKAQKAAEAKGDATVKRPQDGDSAQEWEVYKKALTESPTYKARDAEIRHGQRLPACGTGGHGGDSGTGGRGHPESDSQRGVTVSGATGERRHATEG
ncbi:hypothetical protein U1R68_11150 [Pectobacterium colocasium]|uniref:hypothetical protein n=1 Tax=Pectobacterium colocasium TaxID=2878098 RepID=UPI003305A789